MISEEPRKQGEYVKGAGELDLEEVVKEEVQGTRQCSAREL